MSARKLRQAGFSLIELMVALAIGMAILLALIVMLVNVNRNNSEQHMSSHMIENGRFAVQLLANDIGLAGYWGGYVPNFDDLAYTAAPLLSNDSSGATADAKQVPSSFPNPCQAYDVATWNNTYKANLLGLAVQGSNVTSASVVPFCGAVLTSPRPGNDVLVVRHVEPCLAGSGNYECADTLAAANPDIYFQTTRCNSEPAAGLPAYVMSTNPADFTLHKKDCATVGERRRLASTMYYVKDVSNSGVITPTLMRSQLYASGGAATHQPAQALVENVQAFRVEYGIDAKSDTNEDVVPTAAISWTDPLAKNSPKNRGDGIPEGAFIRCTQDAPCTTGQILNAVTVRIYVLVRAENPTTGYNDDKTYKLGSADTNCTNAAEADTSATCAPKLGPFNDKYRRHLFTQTIRLVNVAGRRETP